MVTVRSRNIILLVPGQGHGAAIGPEPKLLCSWRSAHDPGSNSPKICSAGLGLQAWETWAGTLHFILSGKQTLEEHLLIYVLETCLWTQETLGG
jgi:hypothetical protein